MEQEEELTDNQGVEDKDEEIERAVFFKNIEQVL